MRFVSASLQSSQTAFQEQQNNGPELAEEDILIALANDDMNVNMGDFNDFLVSWPGTDTTGVRSPGASPRGRGNSQPGSPSCSVNDSLDQRSPFPMTDQMRVRICGYLRDLLFGRD